MLRAAQLDPSTLSRMESYGAKPIVALTRNLDAVVDALRASGVELTEDTIRLTRRKR